MNKAIDTIMRVKRKNNACLFKDTKKLVNIMHSTNFKFVFATNQREACKEVVMNYKNCKAKNVKYKDIQMVRSAWLKNMHGIQEMYETVFKGLLLVFFLIWFSDVILYKISFFQYLLSFSNSKYIFIKFFILLFISYFNH